MTNEQAKQEAIRKAWSDLGHPLDDKLLSLAVKNSGWIFWNYVSFYNKDESVLPNGYQESDDRVTIRPKSLSGFHNNNKWTRIEPDGSNLPETSSKKFKVFYNGSFGHIKKVPVDFEKSYSTVELGPLFKEGRITHYKPIDEDKPPIY